MAFRGGRIPNDSVIAFIGGTGPEGRGLGLRFAAAGHTVLIGSREEGRAVAAAEKVSSLSPDAQVEGVTNQDAAARGDVVFIAVPHDAQRQTLEPLAEPLAGKVVVNVVAPLAFSKAGVRAVPVEEGSAAQQSQRLLPRSRVVAGFHSISARDLLAPGHSIDCDVVVCGDDADAKAQVMALAECIPGVRPLDGGGLECARYAEELTALLLNLNRTYKGRAMVKFVGI